ncbi:MAG: DUF5606 domain-containing protein [Bacteroidota bacterium]
MKLKDILAIGGKPGLYKFIAQSKNGIIVESLTDKKRIPAYASDKVSTLEDIAIFTEEDEVPLGNVFNKIYEKEEGGKTLSPKSSADEMKNYFEEILPDYDRERVYVSDIKKVLSWYNQLHDLNMLEPEDEEEEKKATGEIEEDKSEGEQADNTKEK